MRTKQSYEKEVLCLREQLDAYVQEVSDGWLKPAGWLELPMPDAGSQEFYGLFPVWPETTNAVALYVDGTEDYQVDWGDGTVETFTAGTKAEHIFNYSGLSASTEVYNGGFRQSIVHVTMLNNGDMTEFSLDEVPDAWGYTSNWLNINLMGSNISDLRLSPDNNSFCPILRRAGLYELNSITTIDSWFRYCYNLEKLEITGTSNVTTIVSLVDGESRLTELPFFDTSSVTTLGYIQEYVYGGFDLPLYDFSNVTTLTDPGVLANGDYVSLGVPAWDLSSATTTSGPITFGPVYKMDALGIRVSFYVYEESPFLTTSQIVQIFENAGTALPGAVITVSASVTGDLTPAEIAIATDKGFTVTLF